MFDHASWPRDRAFEFSYCPRARAILRFLNIYLTTYMLPRVGILRTFDPNALALGGEFNKINL